MNPDDYDNDGNNIVPCPICLNVHCPSKHNLCYDCGKKLDGQNCSSGGVHDEPRKCPEEDEFIKSMNNTEEKKWEELRLRFNESIKKLHPDVSIFLAPTSLHHKINLFENVEGEILNFISKEKEESYARGVKDTVERVRKEINNLSNPQQFPCGQKYAHQRGIEDGKSVMLCLILNLPSLQINNDKKEEKLTTNQS